VEAVIELAMKLSGGYMAEYGSIKSRHDYTQRQLMACLILRVYLKTTYRGVLDILETSESLRRALGMEDKKLPHYTTLQKFSARSQVQEIAQMLIARVAQACLVNEAPAVAFDSTGLESSSASAHYKSRSGKERRRWVKVSVAIVCTALLPVALVVDWGPTNDKVEVSDLIRQTQAHTNKSLIYADAGYDAEWIHQEIKDGGGQAVIKPARSCRDGRLGGELRSKMTPEYMKTMKYGKRWHVESFFSGLKRMMGSTLNARTDSNLLREATFKVLAYTLHR